MTLGQRIQELRKQAGLSQEALGEALGVSRQAVSKWESDGGIPELDTLIAMSRLFGIPIGQLLGVEQPEEKTENQTALNEEQVEAVLRRYVEESRRPEPEQKMPAASWALAAVVVVATVAILVLGIGRIRETGNTIRELKQQVESLRADNESLYNLYNDMTDDVYEQISAAIHQAQGSSQLVNSFDLKVLSFDPLGETVEVELTAALKEYNADSRLQFLLDWKKTDDTEGRALSDEVYGPDFKTVVTLPMNYRLDVAVRVTEADGQVREQYVDVIHGGMHPDEFELQLTGGLASNHTFTVTRQTFWGQETSVSTQSTKTNGIRIWSRNGELLHPVKGHYVVTYQGETVLEQDVEFREEEGSEGIFFAQVERRSFTMKEAETVVITLAVTDNLGREQLFRQVFRVKDGELIWPENSAPVATD